VTDDRNLYGRATGLAERGKHAEFGGAVDAALADLLVEKNSFFDSVVDRWETLFPGFSAKPARFENGRIVLRVRSAPALYATRPKLRAIAAKLASLPGAPARVQLRLEVSA